MKKIRFPLIMHDGVEVRTMEELKEQFYLPGVLDYIANGKLVVWLRDRYEDDLADAVELLNVNDNNIIEAIYTLFDIPHDEETILCMNELVTVHADKLKHLKEYTREQIYIDHIDATAFTQDDLYELLDEGQTDIYLCGERFEIPLGKSGIQYHGINKPVLVINSMEEIDWEKKNIKIDNVQYDEKYLRIIKERTQSSEVSENTKKENTDDKTQADSVNHSAKNNTLHVVIKTKTQTKKMIVGHDWTLYSKKVYIADEDNKCVKLLTECATDAVICGVRVYYMVPNDKNVNDYGTLCDGELHCYDIGTHSETIIGEAVPQVRKEVSIPGVTDRILGCTEDWLIYAVEETSSIYIYDLYTGSYKVIEDIPWSDNEKFNIIVGDYFYSRYDDNVNNYGVYKISLKTLAVMEIPAWKCSGAQFLGGFINNSRFVFYIYHSEIHYPKYRYENCIRKISCETDEITDIKLPAASDMRFDAFEYVVYYGKLFYIYVPSDSYRKEGKKSAVCYFDLETQESGVLA